MANKALAHNLKVIQHYQAALGIGWIALLVASFLGATLYRVPLATDNLQMVVIILATSLPAIRAVRQDKPLRGITPLNWDARTAALSVGFGFLTALIAYGNYLLFFWRHHLDPRYIDASLPLHLQAVTLTGVTMAILVSVALLFERADKHEYVLSEHLWHNRTLQNAFVFSGLLLGGVVWAPWIQDILHTASLDIIDLLSIVGCVFAYCGARAIQRHTRKHTRHAVLTLHGELQD